MIKREREGAGVGGGGGVRGGVVHCQPQIGQFKKGKL